VGVGHHQPDAAQKSVGDFVALAKQQPRKLNFASVGVGSSNP